MIFLQSDKLNSDILCLMIWNNSHLDFLSDLYSQSLIWWHKTPLRFIYLAQQNRKMTILCCLFYIPFKNKLLLYKHTQLVKFLKILQATSNHGSQLFEFQCRNHTLLSNKKQSWPFQTVTVRQIWFNSSLKSLFVARSHLHA